MSLFSSNKVCQVSPPYISFMDFLCAITPLSAFSFVFLDPFIPFELRILPSIFFPPPQAPLSPRLPVSPLSVDFSTSETKQTESCVSGLVSLRALLDQRSCVSVCPPCSTFSTFLRQATAPFPPFSFELATPWNGNKAPGDRNVLSRKC